jgi:hypothetical protein
LEATLAAGPILANRTYWKVAVTWHRENDEPPAPFGPYLEPTVPAALGPTWTLLGYDVADPGISGLTNCGYDGRDVELKAAWGPRLNEHHLLTTLDDAFAFRNVTNARVVEHAPFFVFGLWRIP